MNRVAVITQPTYLPWLGYFEQISRATVFVFLDCVQFERRSWQCRNRLRASDGEPFWLTVPVAHQPRETVMREIRIAADQRDWRRKHLRSIELHLGAAPYFSEVYPTIERWLNTDYELLAELNIAGIRLICELLDLSPTILRASELAPGGQKAALIAHLAGKVQATHYYSAAGAREYLEAERCLFTEAGIRVVYQEWPHPVYPQQGAGFRSHLAALDALMNVGPAATREMLFQQRPPEATGDS